MKIEDLAFLQEHVSTIDGQRPERVDEVRERVRTARLRRASVAVGSAAVAAVLVAIALLVNQTPHTTPEPTGPPSLQVLAPDPFLSNHAASFWGPRTRLVNALPPRLSHCIRDPHTWGALNTRAATYVDPRPAARQDPPDTRLNEYVLQYSDPASAHRAIRDALQQARNCPKPPGVFKDPSRIQRNAGDSYDEYFANQRTWLSAPDAQPTHVYTLRVARAGNILVVIEDTETASDRSAVWLSLAVDQAVPQYKK